jgi:hypothetical protein
VKKLALTTTVTMPGGKSVLYRFPPEKGLVEVSPGKMRTVEHTTLLLVKPTIIVQREEPTTQPFSRLIRRALTEPIGGLRFVAS